MKAFLIFLLKLVLTGLCLWWAFSQVEFDRSIFTRPGAIDYRWLAGGAALAGTAILFQGLRWWLFLRGQALPVSVGRAVELTMIDSLFSLASVSGLGGDAARIILLMRDHPGRKLVIAMAVMADHLAGLVSLAVLFFIISVARFDAIVDQSILGRGVIHFAWFYLGGGLALVVLIFVCASPPSPLTEARLNKLSIIVSSTARAKLTFRHCARRKNHHRVACRVMESPASKPPPASQR